VVIGGLVPFDLQEAATGPEGRDGVSATVDTGINLLVLAPVGFLVALARRRHGVWLGVAGCAAVSALVELGQATAVSSRHPSWQDFAANVIGGGLGALAGALVHRGRVG
jgi:glycopeptide antibiotics resistance protein